MNLSLIYKHTRTHTHTHTFPQSQHNFFLFVPLQLKKKYIYIFLRTKNIGGAFAPQVTSVMTHVKGPFQARGPLSISFHVNFLRLGVVRQSQNP